MRGKTIYVDARCLQDEAYRWRGVGQHSASVLQYGRSFLSSTFEPEFVAIVDERLPELAAETRALFDRTRNVGYVADATAAWFLQLSPMTHSPLHVARLLERGTACNAAIVYDFIPHDHPDVYLRDEAARLNYYTCLSWLAAYNFYFPISHYTDRRLQDLLGIPIGHSQTTGVAVRELLIAHSPSSTVDTGRHVLVVGGADWRKNVEVAVVAHAQSRLLNERGIPLVVVGGYPANMHQSLQLLHRRHGGGDGLLQIESYRTDEELAQLYRQSFVTVCPSRIEGFSIPVVEANANGCPVLVADCEAQKELVPCAEEQFAADDHNRLRTLLEEIVPDPHRRAAAIARQAGIWQSFTSDKVAGRIWQELLARFEETPTRPAVSRKTKPKLAFVTPLPPDASGVADYSAACLEKLSEHAELHVFSDTPNPRKSRAYASVQPVSAIPYLSKQFDRVISVVGNSHFHLSIMDKLLKHGGACIAHDARMADFYAVLYGAERACRVASRELGRPVSWDEIQSWLANQRRLQALFLREIAEAATPMIVHSRITRQLVSQQYGIETTYLPFAFYRDFPEISEPGRQQARARLGLTKDDVLIGTFGHVGLDRAGEEIIWTIELLRKWGVNARLVFIGRADPAVKSHLDWLTNDIGIQPYVKIGERLVSESEYRDYLVAADAAVQLRTYRLGGLSGALLDCIGAMVPTVANAHLAEAMDAPSYVRRVPDGISPVLIAEKIMEILGTPHFDKNRLEEKNRFSAEHNFGVYTERLMQALALA